MGAAYDCTVRWRAAVFLVAACSGGHREESSLHNTGPSTPARSKPDLDEVRRAVEDLSTAVPFLAPPNDTSAALARLGTPLWLDGITYSDVNGAELHARCADAVGTLQTRAQLLHFVECSTIGDWRHSNPDELTEVSLAHLPTVFARHRARLGDLAADHAFAYSHFCPAAPGDFWTLLAATKDASGQVLIDAILVANDDEGECTEPGR
jgi:hypothetical protein